MNTRPFISTTEQELALQVDWQDAPANQFEITSIDFETNPTRLPIEIGLTKLHLGTGKISRAYWTRLPGTPSCLIPIYPEIRDFLRNSILLAHNKSTETHCLWIGLIIPPPTPLWLDSLNIFKGLMPLLREYSLSEITAHLRLTDQVNKSLIGFYQDPHKIGPHHALWDSTASALALYTLLQQAKLSELTLRQLSHIMPKQGDRPKVDRKLIVEL